MKRLIIYLIPFLLLACSTDQEIQNAQNIKTDTSSIDTLAAVDTIPIFDPIASNFSTSDIILPEGFTYKVLFSEKTDMVLKENGEKFPAKGKHDLTVFIPDTEFPETKGILYISHETSEAHKDLGDGGGATVFDIELTEKGWGVVGDFHHIDFSPVGFTDRNCGGSLAPNGNVLTCEETWGYNNEYFTKKGLENRDFANGREMWENMGYVVEVDPRERKVIKRHMTMGKLVHEDIHVMADGKTAYITDDYSPGVFLKLEMEKSCDFDNGQLYAYKQSIDGESGSWLKLPMDTTSLVNIRKIAVQKGATMIVRHEWIEEIDGKLYISETGEDHFNWDQSLALGGTVPNWVSAWLTDEDGNMDDCYGRILEFDPSTDKMRSYLEGGVFGDSSGVFSNPDCNTSVTIKNKTYLVLSEDINWYDRGRVGRDAELKKDFYNEIYFLDMSIENPSVNDLKRFCVAPLGGETTGVIFLPNGDMIINVQHPQASNPAPFNKSCTILVEGFKR
jgi:hypothetical protein